MIQQKTVDLRNRVLDVINKNFPYESNGKIISIEDIEFTEPKELNSIEDQLKMKEIGEGSLKGALRGKIVITDKSTKKQKKSRSKDLFPIYYATERGTYIVNGVEKNIINQLRLGSGIYTIKEPGKNIVKTEYMFSSDNKDKKYIPLMNFEFNPMKIELNVKIGRNPGNNYNGINFFRELGFLDSWIADKIGNDEISDALFRKAKSNKTIFDIYKDLNAGRKPPTSKEAARLELFEFLENNAQFGKMGETAIKDSLDIKATSLNRDVLGASLKKTFDVFRNDVPSDNRDDLRYKAVMGENDLVIEYLEDGINKLKTEISKSNLGAKDVFTRVRGFNNIGKEIEQQMIQGGPLIQTQEQTNPLFLATIESRLSQFGKKGLSSGEGSSKLTSPRNPKGMSLNRVDPVETPESSDIGLVEHLSQSAEIKNNRIYIPVLKVNNGRAKDKDSEVVMINPTDEYDTIVAFHDSRYLDKNGDTIRFKEDKVPARHKGKDIMADIRDVDYLDRKAQNAFGYAANLIPFLSHNDGNRALMGTNMQRQAVELVNREEPLVQASAGNGKTHEEVIGEKYGKPIRSLVDGIVDTVDNSKIIVKDSRGNSHEHQYHKYFPINQNHINNKIIVKVGDKVSKGDILAEGWSTKNGKLALGANTRVAYLPYKGHNYEDGIVVSKSYAKKMASEEVYIIDIDIKKDWLGGVGSGIKDDVRSYETDPKIITRLDDDGVIKEGETIQPGDVVAVALKPIKTLGDELLSFLNSGPSQEYKLHKEFVPSTSFVGGKIVRRSTIASPGGDLKQRIRLTISNEKTLKLGDKLSGKHGNKGTITKILSDNEMPVAEDGKPIELIFSPLAVPSRKNLGQLLETNAGLIAEKTGKNFIVNNFDHTEKERVQRGLKEIGIPDGKMKVILKERDGSGKIISVPTENKATVGNMYIMKLKHKVDDKLQARSNIESDKLLDRKTYMPAKRSGKAQGEKSNPQSFGEMEMRAMQAHGAVWNILESATLKGDGGGDESRRKEIFQAISHGRFDDLDFPGTPESLNALKTYMQGMGLKLKPMNGGDEAETFDETYNKMAIAPIKPSMLLDMIGRDNEVKDGQAFKAVTGNITAKRMSEGNLKQGTQVPVDGGLFDPKIFGESNDPDARKRWGYIKLGTPIPNPMLISDSLNPYNLLAGFKKNDIQSMMSGKTVMIVSPEQYDGYSSDPVQKKIAMNALNKALNASGLQPGQIIEAEKLQELMEEHGTIPWKAGGEAIQSALEKIDVSKELADSKARLDSFKTGSSGFNNEYKRFKMLRSLKANDMKASDLMIHYVPVAPTHMREISLSSDVDYVDDLNKLYKKVIRKKDKLAKSTDQPNMMDELTPFFAAKTTSEIYKSVSDLFGATVGADEKGRPLKGIKQNIGGKKGLVRSKMLSKRNDFSGRSVIGGDPDLKLNEMGVPADMAKFVYRPFIYRELIRRGRAADEKEAELLWEDIHNNKEVQDIMADVARDRPMLLNRAPSLHKFSIQAFNPVIKYNQDGQKVRNIQLNPMVVTGFNADYDGDSLLNSVFARFKIIDIKTKECYNNGKGDDSMPFENTTIRYNYGVVNLKDFPRGELIASKGNKDIYAVPDDVEVLTVWNGEEKWLPVESFSVHRELEMLDVKTNTSRSVQCSNDHSLVTVDENLNYMRAPAVEGMTLPRLRKPIKENVEFLKFIELPKIDELQYNFKDEIPADFSFGYLNGVYIGDGWTNTNKNKKNALSLASDSKQIPNKIKEIVSSYCDKEIHICSVPSPHTFEGKESYCEKHTWSSSRFAAYFKENMGQGAANKHLPLFWMRTAESFRWGLLSGLIDTDGTVALCSAKSKKSKQININYTTISTALAYEIVALAHTLNLTASVSPTQTPKGEVCYVVVFTQESVEMMQRSLFLATEKKRKMLAQFKPSKDYKRNKYTPKLSKDRLLELRKAIGSPRIKNRDGKTITGDIKAAKKRKSLYAVCHRVSKDDTALTKQTALDIFDLNIDLFKDEFWIKWKSMVLNEEIEWEMVTEITPIPFITEAYDLTIPPAYTMVTESGIVVYDTMAVHVPVTERAKEEAKRLMMPSTNLINPTDGKLIIELRHEMALGIYYLTINKKPSGKGLTFSSYRDIKEAYRTGKVNTYTKASFGKYKDTTVGKLLFNLLIPESKRDFSKAWSSKMVKEMLMEYYREVEKGITGKSESDRREGFGKISNIIDNLKDIGFLASTKSGLSIGLNDFKKPESVNKLIKNEQKSLSGKSNEEIINTWSSLEKKIQGMIESEDIYSDDNPVKIMMTSGARAKPDQIRRMAYTVGVGKDISGNLTAPVITSHLDGLAPQEYINHSFDSRKGLYDRSVSTRDPGIISREVWSATQDVRITIDDCGTSKGIDMLVSKPSVVGRLLSQDAKKGNMVVLKKGEFIDNELRKKLTDNDIELVNVRSPMTCEAVSGVCKKCYGAMPGTNRAPRMGEAIGVLASQALGEPVTQLTMNTFHSGGTSSAATLGASSIDRILNIKEDPVNNALLSSVTGEVKSISQGTKGTYDTVVVGSKKHMIPHDQFGRSKPLKVRVGDTVSSGDFLTYGDIDDIRVGAKIQITGDENMILTHADPKKLFKLKSSVMPQGQALDYTKRYMVDSMSDIFSKTLGSGSIDDKHLETIVGKLASRVVIEDPGDSDYIKGDYIDEKEAIKWNAENTGPINKKSLPLTMAGKLTGKVAHGNYKDKGGVVIVNDGDILDRNNIPKLLMSGFKTVNYRARPIKYRMELMGKKKSAVSSSSWFGNMGAEDLSERMREGTLLGNIDNLDDPRSRQMSGKLLNIGEGASFSGRNTITQRLFNLFDKDK